jgi:hypothetical protein
LLNLGDRERRERTFPDKKDEAEDLREELDQMIKKTIESTKGFNFEQPKLKGFKTLPKYSKFLVRVKYI